MINEITLRNTSTDVSYVLNNYDATFLIEDGSIDWGSVESKHNTYNYPEQIGRFISTSIVGARTITIYGWVVGRGADVYENLKLKKNLLNRFINPLQQLEIEAGGYRIFGKPDAQVKYSNTYKENNDVMCKFFISVYCPSPVFEPIIPISVDLAEMVPAFHFPLAIVPSGIVMGSREISLITDIYNDGVNAVGAAFTLVAKSVVNNPKIINVSTQEFMLINATLQINDTIVINTNAGNHSIRAIINGVEQNFLQHFDLDSTWMQFKCGKTTIGFSTSLNGVPDDTYKSLDINVSYKTSLYNLEEE